MAHLIQPLDKIYEAGKACCDALLKRTAYELNTSTGCDGFGNAYFSTTDNAGVVEFRDDYTVIPGCATSDEIHGYVGFGVCCATQTEIDVSLYAVDSDTRNQIDCWVGKIYRDSGDGVWVLQYTHDACDGDDEEGFTWIDFDSPDACGFRYKVEFIFLWLGGAGVGSPTIAGFDLAVTIS